MKWFFLCKFTNLLKHTRISRFKNNIGGNIMDHLKKSHLSFIKKDCIAQFGLAAGTKIYYDAFVIMTELLEDADFRNSKAVEKHMRGFILPEIAYYRALQKNEIGKEKAYQFLDDEIQKRAQKSSRVFGAFKRLPWFFSIVKLVIKKAMAYGFPKEGWNTEWKVDNNNELAMNMHSCLYMETFTKYGCPELCIASCDSDVTTFRGMEPKVVFLRTQTLSKGADYCNFRYMNGKRLNKFRFV